MNEVIGLLTGIGVAEADAELFVANTSAIGQKIVAGFINQLSAVDGSVTTATVTNDQALGLVIGIDVTALGFNHTFTLSSAVLAQANAEVPATEAVQEASGTAAQPSA